VFGSRTAASLAGYWKELERQEKYAIRKVSIVPDHAHLAVRTHPAVAPASLVLMLMNSAQQFLFENHREDVLAAKLPQIWYPGAYIGSYGDVTVAKVRNYIRDWEEEVGENGGEGVGPGPRS